MNVTDISVLAVLAMFAFVGWRSGLISNVFTGVGLLGGFIAGTQLIPKIYKPGSDDPIVALSAIGLMIACALVGSNVLAFFGRLIPRPPGRLRVVDSLLGSAFNIAVAAMAVWGLGYAITSAPALSITDNVRESRVLAIIDRQMPESATQVLAAVSNTITTDVFPRYLDPFEKEPIVAVDAPDDKFGDMPGVRKAAKSTVQVRGNTKCRQTLSGSGFVYAPGRVVTNAHVLLGVREPTVTRKDKTWDAKVVLFDPELDLAVLSVPGLDLKPLKMAKLPKSGDPAAVLGHPKGGPLVKTPARVRTVTNLRSPDLEQKGRVERDVISLKAAIAQGNSGGPVVTGSGQVLGMIFAASMNDANTAYALTARQMQDSLMTGSGATKRVPSGKCR